MINYDFKLQEEVGSKLESFILNLNLDIYSKNNLDVFSMVLTMMILIKNNVFNNDNIFDNVEISLIMIRIV